MKKNLEAVKYLESGYSIFPVRPKGKEPLFSWGDFQTRRASKEEVEKWWGKYPEANIAIVTGQISGIIVLDVDGEEGKRSIEGLSIPETATAKTGGGGLHYIFKHPGVECKNFTRKLPGIDFRGDGGYIVAPPSTHENGKKYEWLKHPSEVGISEAPDWLLELVKKKNFVIS